ENVGWLLGREGARGRAFLFAHDYHVQAAEQPKAPRPSDARAPLHGGFPLGTHLRSLLGRDLVILGSTAGEPRGWPDAARRAPPESIGGSLCELASAPGLPLYVADLRRLPESGPLRAWMSGVQVDGVFRDRSSAPARAYDALIFQGVLTPAARLGT